jgi:hypothetical protein
VGPVADGEVAAMFWCRDHSELLHVWSHRGQHRVYRPRRGQEPWEVDISYARMWDELFPSMPSESLTDLINSPGRWAKRRPTHHAPMNYDGPRQTGTPGLDARLGLQRRVRRTVRGARRAWRSPDPLPPPASPPIASADDP